MATYRYDKYEDWSGTIFYAIEKKTFFGWREEKYWVISNIFDKIIPEVEVKAKKEMMECVDRLIKAGHTVI